MSNYEIVKTYNRKLPQVDYYYKPLYAQDIIFSFNDKGLITETKKLLSIVLLPEIFLIIEKYYDREYYLLFANIVFEPYITNRWDRHIRDVFPFIMKLNHCDCANVEVPDTKVEFLPHDYNNRYVKCLICHRYDCNDYRCSGIVRDPEYSMLIKNVKGQYDFKGQYGFNDVDYFPILGYYEDPTKSVPDAISLKRKYDIWMRDYKYDGIFPYNKFDILCFLMLIHDTKINYVDSGK